MELLSLLYLCQKAQCCYCSLHVTIAWNDVIDCIENRAFLTQALEIVLQVLMQRSSIVQRYLTVLEVPSMTHGFPMLSPRSITSIIAHCPITHSKHVCRPHEVSHVYSHSYECYTSTSPPSNHQLWHLAHSWSSHSRVISQIRRDPLSCNPPDGTANTSAMPLHYFQCKTLHLTEVPFVCALLHATQASHATLPLRMHCLTLHLFISSIAMYQC